MAVNAQRDVLVRVAEPSAPTASGVPLPMVRGLPPLVDLTRSPAVVCSMLLKITDKPVSKLRSAHVNAQSSPRGAGETRRAVPRWNSAAGRGFRDRGRYRGRRHRGSRRRAAGSPAVRVLLVLSIAGTPAVLETHAGHPTKHEPVASGRRGYNPHRGRGVQMDSTPRPEPSNSSRQPRPQLASDG